jgi:hypothetical protein
VVFIISKCIQISPRDLAEENDKKWPILASIVLTDEDNADKIKIICITTESKGLSGKLNYYFYFLSLIYFSILIDIF